jgi:cysteinyl-tRNA synthetase
MEVVQFYTLRYREAMKMLNVLPPSIEPSASGHVIEQIELVRRIIGNGYAYEKNGSVYFDVVKYNMNHRYGVLSNRNIDELLNASRELEGGQEKNNPVDFALWKKAQPEHIMHWPSPWGEGFPGWHCECTAMSGKYLGTHFDIQGGGMDLIFPHHECEIAQAVASQGDDMVKYWIHNNMITINGRKMGKSLGNFITLEEFFTGSSKSLSKACSPMTIRFFILQAHYRSTLDFSDEALQAAEKGLEKLLEAYANLSGITPGAATSAGFAGLSDGRTSLRNKCLEALCDDLNTPVVIASLFDAARIVNTIKDGNGTVSEKDLRELKDLYKLFIEDILGLKSSGASLNAHSEQYRKAVDLLLVIRQKAKENKDWVTSDRIRNELTSIGFKIKDTKDGFEWSL